MRNFWRTLTRFRYFMSELDKNYCLCTDAIIQTMKFLHIPRICIILFIKVDVFLGSKKPAYDGFDTLSAFCTSIITVLQFNASCIKTRWTGDFFSQMTNICAVRMQCDNLDWCRQYCSDKLVLVKYKFCTHGFKNVLKIKVNFIG